MVVGRSKSSEGSGARSATSDQDCASSVGGPSDGDGCGDADGSRRNTGASSSGALRSMAAEALSDRSIEVTLSYSSWTELTGGRDPVGASGRARLGTENISVASLSASSSSSSEAPPAEGRFMISVASSSSRLAVKVCRGMGSSSRRAADLGAGSCAATREGSGTEVRGGAGAGASPSLRNRPTSPPWLEALRAAIMGSTVCSAQLRRVSSSRPRTSWWQLRSTERASGRSWGSRASMRPSSSKAPSSTPPGRLRSLSMALAMMALWCRSEG